MKRFRSYIVLISKNPFPNTVGVAFNKYVINNNNTRTDEQMQ